MVCGIHNHGHLLQNDHLQLKNEHELVYVPRHMSPVITDPVLHCLSGNATKI